MLYYDTVVFDLDGTLFDTSPGILATLHETFSRIGRKTPDDAVLRRFIGPSLWSSFQKYCGMTVPETEEGIRIFRSLYWENGWCNSRVYPGIRLLLKELKRRGARVYVATGKPEDISTALLKKYDLWRYIDGIAATAAQETVVDKNVLLSRLLSGKKYDKAVMIGDVLSDVSGARAFGIDAIGVGYGFGVQDEFDSVQPCPVAESTEALTKLLMDAPPAHKGYFISIEGLDGCGKTTQFNAVEQALEQYGYRVRRTREPGGCPISEKIRGLLLDVENTGMSDITEALLYASSRAQHVREVIRPAIERGEVVLCDRFVDSSVAFQGGGRELGVPLIQQINAPALDGCLPDATVYLRLDHETALKRRENASALDRIESEAASFHARVEAAYEELVQQDPKRFIAVDAKKEPQEITEEIIYALLARLDEAEVM